MKDPLLLFLTDDIIYKQLLLTALLFVSFGCASSENRSGNGTSDRPSAHTPPTGQVTVPGQLMASNKVFTINLNRKGNQQSPPVLRINSNQQLRLSFDLLEIEARQLRVTFTHHNPDWSPSGLAEDFYKDGFYNLNIDDSRLSRTERPSYRRYTYDFPNDNIRFLVSGNYMLRVEDAGSGDFLFSTPFFVTENEGNIRSEVETRTVPRRNSRISHRPRSTYELPDFVETPQFDLQFYYVQNQFWGRNRQAKEIDTSTEGEVLFELRAEEAFTGDYEFQFLDLTRLSQQAQGVLEYRPAEIPPRIVLFDDVQGFSASRERLPGSRINSPDTSLSARYANVYFTFNPNRAIPDDAGLYLFGDFNNWSIESRFKLDYHPEMDRWRTNGFIKTGTYAYKYVLVENNRIDDLALDDSFTRSMQEYHAFVYFKDPDRFYYRLLQINNFFKNS